MLFYLPGGVELNSKAIPIDVKHVGDISELEAHSAFGHMQAKATKQYFDDKHT